MAPLLVLYILIGIALVVLGVFMLTSKKPVADRKEPEPLSETRRARPGSES